MLGRSETSMSPPRVLRILLVVLLALLQPSLWAQPQTPRVLLLHSYHQGLPWTDSVHQGFVEGLGARAQSPLLFVEYLDALRSPLHTPAAEAEFAERLVQRYRGRGIDLLVATDDAALHLVLAYRSRLAPGKPVLFAGASNLRAEELQGQDKLAGVAETPHFDANLALMQRLHPQVSTLRVVGDASPTFRSNLAALQAANAQLRRPFRVDVLASERMDDTLAALRQRAGESLVFLMGRPLDARGDLVTGPQFASLVRQAVALPIYTAWDFYLGHGVVGGELVSGGAQGHALAELTMAVMDGQPVSALPRVVQSPNRYAFDYRELVRHGLAVSQLPAGAQVLYRPPSVAEKYPQLFVVSTALLVVLAALLVIQGVYGRRNRALSRALERELTLLEALMGAVPLPMFFKDSAMRYQRVNDTFLRFLGKTRAQLLSQTVEAVAPSAQAETFRSKDAELMAHGGMQVYESQITAGDGSVHDVVFHKATVRLADGSCEGIVGAMLDVTELRRIERDLRDLNQELEARVAQRTHELVRANGELQKAVDSLSLAQDELVRSERMSSLGSMVAGVAHELNTPIGNSLTVATGLQHAMAQLAGEIRQGSLRRSALDAFLRDGESATGILARSLERAATLVANFKEVAVDQTSDRRRSFALRGMVEEIVATFTTGHRDRVPQVVVDVAPELMLESYPGALGQILLNLLDNARTHAFSDSAPGEIRIAAIASGDGKVQISVSDNGKGISAENLARIFEPFFTTRLGQGGSGLGLFVVYRLATQVLVGRIRVSSQPGRGTMLVLELPTQAPVREPRGPLPPEPADAAVSAQATVYAVPAQRTHASSVPPAQDADTPAVSLHLRDDLLDIRELVESKAAAAAAAQATESDKRYLQSIFERLDASFVGDDLEAQVECDFAFHLAILEATHDPALVKVGEAIIQLMYGHIRGNLSGMNPNPRRRATLRAQHRTLFEAIMAGDASAAAAVAAAHMAFVRSEGAGRNPDPEDQAVC